VIANRIVAQLGLLSRSQYRGEDADGKLRR